MTPKALIHQKYGDKACYKVEEVQVPPQNGCPGLAIPQKAPPCLYRCILQLPEATIVSDTFKRKKEAEQSAAEKAIEKVFCVLFSKNQFLYFYSFSVSVEEFDLAMLVSCQSICSFLDHLVDMDLALHI